ncbi:MAG: helix-turn-helix domain-containing protein [Brevefilum sp.]|jgi:DNA-binding Xre family transcriptional regulator
MKLELEVVLQQIRRIRKAKVRCVKDCAAFLEISKDDYRSFEAGTHPLALQQIELLADYFEVPVQDFFSGEPYQVHSYAYTDRETRKKYSQLRQKMIRTMLLIEQSKQSRKLEQIHDQTQVSRELLKGHLEDDKPIRLDHFLEICDALAILPGQFFEPPKEEEFKEIEDTQPVKWIPEFPEEIEKPEDFEEDPFHTLIEAIRHMPFEDQAIIAKTILQQLRKRPTQKTHSNQETANYL